MFRLTPPPAQPRHPAVVLTESVDPRQRLEAHLTLATRASGRGDDAAARVHYEAALALAPDDARAKAGLRALGGSERPARAGSRLLRLLLRRR